MARIITPLSVGLNLSGRFTIDLVPWIFTWIALLVERIGVAAFCTGYEADEDEAPDHKVPEPKSHERMDLPERHGRLKPVRHGTPHH